MRQTAFVLLFLLTFTLVKAQDCFTKAYSEAQLLYEQGLYQDAYNWFEMAGKCSDVPTQNDLPSRLTACLDKINKTHTPLTAVQDELDDMVFVEGGTFIMGATPEQLREAYEDEKPAREVTVGSFFIGRKEVSQRLWRLVMGRNPSKNVADTLPVEQVSWNDCKRFVDTLCTLTGMRYTLPTEAQWEYAARGGKLSNGFKYSGSNNLYEVGWFIGNATLSRKMGLLKPNELGIYDMSGNVAEWCLSLYNQETGSHRSFRGGNYGSMDRYCRNAMRNRSLAAFQFPGCGLRLVRLP